MWLGDSGKLTKTELLSHPVQWISHTVVCQIWFGAVNLSLRRPDEASSELNFRDRFNNKLNKERAWISGGRGRTRARFCGTSTSPVCLFRQFSRIRFGVFNFQFRFCFVNLLSPHNFNCVEQDLPKVFMSIGSVAIAQKEWFSILTKNPRRKETRAVRVSVGRSGSGRAQSEPPRIIGAVLFLVFLTLKKQIKALTRKDELEIRNDQMPRSEIAIQRVPIFELYARFIDQEHASCATAGIFLPCDEWLKKSWMIACGVLSRLMQYFVERKFEKCLPTQWLNPVVRH